MTGEAPDAPDTGASSQVTDHAFVPRVDEPWGLCVTCRLSRAAHTSGPVYIPIAERPRDLPGGLHPSRRHPAATSGHPEVGP